MKIVAPAGNMERFYSAVNAGADASWEFGCAGRKNIQPAKV